MGSKVSRHSGKGLSGRRAQSSGSLYKMLAPRVGKVLNRCGNGILHQNKFCGSLPNQLDEKRFSSCESSPESLYYPSENYDDICRVAKTKKVDFFFENPQDSGANDQGYGSEWSPEDDLSLSADSSTFYRSSTVRKSSDVSFITKENTFEVRFEKGSRGLGLSVTGGIDTAERHPGLIRIKRIFPHQPAWECGTLEVGDIILEANGTSLTGLTNNEALEVLRTISNNIMLKICRPPFDEFLSSMTDMNEPPFLPTRDSNRNVLLSSQTSNSKNRLHLPSTEPYGQEFDVILNKINGGLGFTLRKEDESILGHYVRALVREPAISDGRIRPGDKIVSVNGRDISSMSHAEAVAFLRQIEDEVRLRLYRDPVQTPVSALSPTESHKIFRPRPVLRKEAMDMLSTLAVRKLSPNDSGNSENTRSRLRSTSPGSSPRRRKLNKTSIEPEEAKSKTEENLTSPLNSNFVENAGENEDLRLFEENDGESVSMPTLPSTICEFSYKNPAYQSINPMIPSEGKAKVSELSSLGTTSEQKEGSQGLLKWKGVVFNADEKENEEKTAEKISSNERVFTIELCKGWNSRLGFSLKNYNSKTLISAIYPDSLAARDGRLREGDIVIKINGESTTGMTTSSVIELLRKVRGATAITVIRNIQTNP